MLATLRKLKEEAERLALAAARPDASANKKKRAKEILKLQNRVQLALEENRIEDDVKDVKLERVFSPGSTKQVMIARVSLHVRAQDPTLISCCFTASCGPCYSLEPLFISWLWNCTQELLSRGFP